MGVAVLRGYRTYCLKSLPVVNQDFYMREAQEGLEEWEGAVPWYKLQPICIFFKPLEDFIRFSAMALHELERELDRHMLT